MKDAIPIEEELFYERTNFTVAFGLTHSQWQDLPVMTEEEEKKYIKWNV